MTIPAILRGLIGQFLGVLGTIIIVCYANVYFIAVVIPLGAVFYFLQKFYVNTARQVKRLESISRSPIYSHFGETVSGATTIRAYNLTRQFISTNEKKIDDNQVCYYSTFVSSRWLAVRLGGHSKSTSIVKVPTYSTYLVTIYTYLPTWISVSFYFW